jgi:ferrous iron transport protein B
MAIKIALVGNPNSGKTTLFNNLTGSMQYVGNWPGVTVEKKEGKIKGFKDATVVDLPGIYSLSPYTLEEVVSRNFIINEKPDVIINIVDATNLERNLYLTTQVVELGIPVVIALNMIDIVEKNGDIFNTSKLEEITGCKVVEISALKGRGTKEVAKQAIEVASANISFKSLHKFSDNAENIINEIENLIKDSVTTDKLRFTAIKLFEKDSKININYNEEIKNKIDNIIKRAEKKFDDDSESIITNERYSYIESIVKSLYIKKNTVKNTISDKIDKVATNRWAAIPVFAIVMFLVYFLAVATIGAMATDWVNEVLFGEWIPNLAEKGLDAINAAFWLKSLVIDGIIAGVGSVLGFLPQMAILFLLLAILEDVGYLSRIAFILDKVFRKFGLSGKSFIPMMIGTGCSIPGIMASRTIENENDRKITIMTTSFIPCGAKLPIIALIAGAMFNNSAIIAFSAYLLGIIAVLLSGIILKKFKSFQGSESPFIMELPSYHMPNLKNVLMHTWERLKSFVIKAGTIIFAAAVIIWLTSNFSWNLKMVEMDESILASIGKLIQFIFIPLGWGDWKATVATILGLVAKENVVNAFGILYGVEQVSEAGQEIWSALPFTALSAYSFMVFNLLCAPCFAAIGAIRREMGSNKWTWITIGFQTALAYVLAISVYQIGLLFGGTFTAFTIPAIILFVGFIYLIVRPVKKN